MATTNSPTSAVWISALDWHEAVAQASGTEDFPKQRARCKITDKGKDVVHALAFLTNNVQCNPRSSKRRCKAHSDRRY